MGEGANSGVWLTEEKGIFSPDRRHYLRKLGRRVHNDIRIKATANATLGKGEDGVTAVEYYIRARADALPFLPRDSVALAHSRLLLTALGRTDGNKNEVRLATRQLDLDISFSFFFVRPPTLYVGENFRRKKIDVFEIYNFF